jgi:hypothetical protein
MNLLLEVDIKEALSSMHRPKGNNRTLTPHYLILISCYEGLHEH